MLLGALLVGAPAAAQQRAPGDTVVRDSVRGDSVPRTPARPDLAADTLPPDTIKAAFAWAERPDAPEVRGGRYEWSREQLYLTGALNLAELMVEVPGVGLQRSSYLMSPIVLSYYGEPGRIRVFFDGVELDPLDPRMRGTFDLATIPLYTLQSVSAERVGAELRVHLRSWQVSNTTPFTRVDVGTGSENYTLYRGYYGKRFQNGLGVQIAGQQFNTVNGLTRGDGESFGTMARVGWARGVWSVDALGMSTGRERAATRRYIRTTPENEAMARFDGDDRFGYLRFGFRNPDSTGVWLQAVASTQQYLETDSAAANAVTPDPDTLISQAQYVLTGGVTSGALRVSGSARYRMRGGRGRVAPSARASWTFSRASVAASVELEGPDSTARSDLSGRIQPLQWIHLAAAASQYSSGSEERSVLRGEVGLTVAGRWLTAGVIQRSAATVNGMFIYDSNYVSALIPESQGLFASLGGNIWGPFYLDWQGINWGDEQLYRPKMESRAVLRASSAFLKSIPRNTFRLEAAFVHDYRSDLLAPDGLGGVAKAKGNSALSLLIDVRLGSAHIFFHNRNFTGEVYETVPGYLMPRLAQQYGVRWDFWN